MQQPAKTRYAGSSGPIVWRQCKQVVVGVETFVPCAALESRQVETSPSKGKDARFLRKRKQELNDEIEILNGEARDLEERIAENITLILG